MMDKETLQHHLKHEHEQSVLSENLKEIVYGGIDGIITTFAVVAGFTGATMMATDRGEEGIAISVSVVLVFGLANLFADGFSMGVGDFLSSRAEKKLFDKEQNKEVLAIEKDEEFEYDETVFILMEKGFTKENAQTITDIYKENPEFWAEFMMRYELNMTHPEESPVRSALITFASFIMFGAIPLLPYIFNIVFFDGKFMTASVFTAFALALLGFIRAKFTKERIFTSMLEIVGLGMMAAFIAYFVGTFFA
jgi:VIT1/CCC1 family predicted Fe2+/Mn2+ transporter